MRHLYAFPSDERFLEKEEKNKKKNARDESTSIESDLLLDNISLFSSPTAEDTFNLKYFEGVIKEGLVHRIRSLITVGK